MRPSRRARTAALLVMSLIAIISIYREGGILKRLRATPLSPVTILSAHVVVKLVFTRQERDGIGDGFKIIQQADHCSRKFFLQVGNTDAPRIIRKLNNVIDNRTSGGQTNHIWRRCTDTLKVMASGSLSRRKIDALQRLLVREPGGALIGERKSRIRATDIAD